MTNPIINFKTKYTLNPIPIKTQKKKAIFATKTIQTIPKIQLIPKRQKTVQKATTSKNNPHTNKTTTLNIAKTSI